MKAETPGPWANIPKGNHEGKPWTYVIIAGDDDTVVAEVMLPGDSNLIATAQEMLEKLEQTAACLRAYRVQVAHLGCEPWIAVDLDPSIDALIAKARGES
jgi:predicted signal transduction protein with EAL and GGDEF domain